MENSTFCLLGPLEWARSIGKETSDTSFAVSALKRDEKVVNLVYPSKYPEKVWSLAFTLFIADNVFMNITNIDRELGEAVIALDLLGKRNGSVSVHPDVDRVRLSSVLKGTVVEGYSDFDPRPGLFRDRLLDLRPPPRIGPTRVFVDQAFNVKGVGCVALGFVASGEVRKHQDLSIAPGGGRAQVRSIQVQDRDFDSAQAGARVGLALKGVTPEDIPKGGCLNSDDPGVLEGSDLRLNVRPSKYWKGTIEPGVRLHLVSGFQFVPVTFHSVEKGADGQGNPLMRVEARTDSPIWFTRNDRLPVCYLDSRTFRIIASGESF